MAARQLILSSPLCFLVNKYGKIQLNTLKSVVVDFYCVETIVEAKSQLLDDVETLNLPVKLPHIPRRRESQCRIAKEVDDLITVLQHLDENGYLDKLPRYVNDHPDNMPSVRLCEGDMIFLLNRVDKLEAKLSEISAAMMALNLKCTSDSGVFSTACTATHAGCQTDQTWAKVITSRNSVDSHPGPSTSSARPAQVPQLRQLQTQPVATGSWAERSTTSSTPMGNPSLGNRFSALMSTTDDEAAGSSDGFQVVHNRRSARRNKRALESPPAKQNEPNTDAKKRTAAKGKTRIFGKADPPGTLRAAEKLYKKAIFCIDNVGKSCSSDDMLAHVSNLGAHVISCYPAVSRRRRNESPSKAAKRRAFRLCISADDQEIVLNPDNWPDSITVSDWYFKKPADQDQDKRRRLDESTAGAGANASSSAAAADEQSDDNAPVADLAAHQDESAMDDESVDDDDDTTLTATDHSQPSDTNNSRHDE